MIILEKCLIVLIVSELNFLQVSLASPQIQSRIIGGAVATINKAPFIVRILGDCKYRCGGTLVAPLFVVTAAHCVTSKKISNYSIVAGVTSDYETGVRSWVSRIILPKNKHWDLAVLELESAVKGLQIQPIDLCKTTWSPGSNVQLYGWGKLNKFAKISSMHLRTVTLKVIEEYKCESKYRNLVNITNTMFCASVPNSKSPCHGDSGGPAIIKGQFCGVLSSGIDCNSQTYPNIFINVWKVRYFINHAMRTLSAMRSADLLDI